MVNPYTDPRYQMARLMTNQNNSGSQQAVLGDTITTPSKAGVALGRAATNMTSANPTLRDAINSIASGQKQASSGGVVGTVLGNPVAKTVLKGLEAFALPGRAVVAGARELVDAVDRNDATKASFSDFAKNVKDSQYGFGKAFKINTGSKWIDRAIGFAGDVALDPLTYATFGASAGLKGVEGAAKLGTHTAGYANRITLANRILKQTGDKALAKAVAIEGRAALRNVANGSELLERVGANKFGVYFFGKRIFKERGGLRLPLSGTIGEIGEATLAKARLGITKTRLGEYMQKMTMPKDFLELRLAVARNKLGAEEAANAIKLFEAVPKQRLARATAQQALEQELMTVLKSEESNIDSYRNTLHRFIEDPAKLAAASPEEQRAVAVWQTHLGRQWDRVSGRWQEVDEFAQLGKTENYFPRVRTDEAGKWLSSDAPHAADVRAIFMEDPFALPGAFTPRSLRAGKKWFGVVLKEKDLNIDSLNKIAREQGGLDFDFFETDIVNVMKKYASDTADELGIIERNAALKEAGFFDKLDEMRVTELEVNQDDIARAKQILDEQNNILNSVEQELRQSVVDLGDNVRAEASRVSQNLATGEKLTQDLSKYLYDMLDDVARKTEQVNLSKARVQVLFGPEGSIPMYALSDDFPVMLRPVLAEFDGMVKTLEEYSSILSDLHAESMKFGYDAISAETSLRQIEEAAKTASPKLQNA